MHTLFLITHVNLPLKDARGILLKKKINKITSSDHYRKILDFFPFVVFTYFKFFTRYYISSIIVL